LNDVDKGPVGGTRAELENLRTSNSLRCSLEVEVFFIK